MNLMTPEEARLTIRDTEDLRPDLLKSWRALETIANMHEEWGVAVTYPGLAEVVEWGYSTQAGALEEVELASTAFGAEYRIVRRYVTEPEETK